MKKKRNNLDDNNLDIVDEKDNNIDILEESDTNSVKEDNNKKKSKRYIGYGKKLSGLIIILVIYIILSIILLFSILKFISSKKITYNENSTSLYDVCVNDDDYYDDNCLGENMEYLSTITDKVNYLFTYNVLYNKKIQKKFRYHVEGTLKIYSPDSKNEILYEKKYLFLENKSYNSKGNVFTVSDSTEIPYRNINKLVVDYNNKYSLISNADLEVNFIVDNKSVSSLSIPMGKQTFTVSKKDIENSKTMDVNYKDLFVFDFIVKCVTLAVTIILVIIYIIKIILFFNKYRNKTSKFQKQLNSILGNYDRIIVEVSDVSSILVDKKLLEISDFLELVDVRDTIDKPILHVKINDVKHAFYVEDKDKVYEYILKESQFENKK